MIELTGKYAIDKDTECWTVYKLGKRKGQPEWRPIWYYPSLKFMIAGLLDRGFEIPNELSKLSSTMDHWAKKIVERLEA